MHVTARLLVLLLATFALAGPAVAQLKDENLLVSLPDGFKLGHRAAKGPRLIAEYVPNGETVQNWSQMITLQVFRDLARSDPAVLAGNIAALWTRGCAGGTAGIVQSFQENGYPATLWRYACPLNTATGQPENMWLKAVGGADALYVVQLAFRLELAASHQEGVLIYLETVSVCDTRTPEHPCPAGL